MSLKYESIRLILRKFAKHAKKHFLISDLNSSQKGKWARQYVRDLTPLDQEMKYIINYLLPAALLAPSPFYNL